MKERTVVIGFLTLLVLLALIFLLVKVNRDDWEAEEDGSGSGEDSSSSSSSSEEKVTKILTTILPRCRPDSDESKSAEVMTTAATSADDSADGTNEND